MSKWQALHPLLYLDPLASGMYCRMCPCNTLTADPSHQQHRV